MDKIDRGILYISRNTCFEFMCGHDCPIPGPLCLSLRAKYNPAQRGNISIITHGICQKYIADHPEVFTLEEMTEVLL